MNSKAKIEKFEDLIAWQNGYLDRLTFQKLLEQAEEVARITGGLRAAIARQRN